VRQIIHEADPEIVGEWKWRGVPVWSHDGFICTGEVYKNHVKMTFPKGASLEDPSGLFNASLEGNAWRAINIHEGDNVDEAAVKDLIRAAVALNLECENKAKPKPKAAASHQQAGRPVSPPVPRRGSNGFCACPSRETLPAISSRTVKILSDFSASGDQRPSTDRTMSFVATRQASVAIIGSVASESASAERGRVPRDR
jgi:hypothetical protein